MVICLNICIVFIGDRVGFYEIFVGVFKRINIKIRFFFFKIV